MDTLSPRLVDLARLVAQTDRPDDAAASVAHHVASSLNSADVSVWLLDRGDARYIPHAGTRGDHWEHFVIASEGLVLPATTFSSSSAIVSALAPRELSDAREIDTPSDGTLVAGYRGATIIGFLLIADQATDEISADCRVELELCAQLLVQIYQREFSYTHLKASQTPVNFYGSERDLFQSLILQIAESARMEFVALREFDESTNSLHTLETWGFDSSYDLRQFDLAPISDYPPFVQALEGEPVVAPSMRDPALASLARRAELAHVKSFVALPIRVGNEIFGVLSVAAGCEYVYNTLERRAFEGLANSAGLAIRYFRSNHEVTGQVREFTEISTALTAVEVAQSSRHEAITKMGNAKEAIAGVRRAIKAGNSGMAVQRLEKLTSDNKEIEEALNKIRLAITPKIADLAEISVISLWKEARNATAGKLAKLRVDVQITGADRLVWVYPDRIRQVFINLFLNSTDAFETMSSSARRQIAVRVEKPDHADSPIVFTYRDNAGGLQSQLLRLPEVDEVTPIERLVFSKGVTSKETGTGYGLWLADRFMQFHAGSIAVIERRGGMMFELELPHPSSVELIDGKLKKKLATGGQRPSRSPTSKS
jgi:signal transduction histidine kinase